MVAYNKALLGHTNHWACWPLGSLVDQMGCHLLESCLMDLLVSRLWTHLGNCPEQHLVGNLVGHMVHNLAG